jgi:hypothetical protein
VRAVQWSNDVLSTLLDLYEEKYLALGGGSFSSQGLGIHLKKACDTYSCRKCEDNSSMSWQIRQDEEKIFSRKDSKRYNKFYKHFMGLV